MKKNILTILSSIFLLTTFSCTKEETSFIISSPDKVAHIVINEDEEDLVHIACGLLSNDIFIVSGQRPELASSSKSLYQIKTGTLGVDEEFDKACEEVGIDSEQLKTKWEGYCIKAVIKDEGGTLFIVGSDPRGTAFGLMELSRMIGVSPWVWWADINPQKQKTISLPGDLLLEDAPKVKFRGIFLNDEDWGLQPWAAKNIEPETGDIGPKTYEKIFELLLRLKANTIWPAMHPCTKAFYTIPGNKEMAAKYQIFVGTSHAEPMLRNNVDEWDKKQFGDYDYSTNKNIVQEYWKSRIEELNKEDKYIITMGMRGIHDSGMQGNFTSEEKVEMLETIISDQRKMLGDILEKDVKNIPQAFVPYKEVLEIYKDGAKIPEDVTLVWPDDNHGYIRQLSNASERMRPGGGGVYYHISYWGRPHDFLWLESVPVSLIWEEMNKAYQTNAKNEWIVNVGDIKSNEIGMNFFLEMAWNPDQYSPESLDSYYTQFAENQFGNQYAEEIGNILKKYFQLGFSRKPEHMGWNGVYPNTPVQDPKLSLFYHGDEVQKRIDAYEKLEKQVESLYEKIPDNLKDAFYQLVAYKVIGASNMNKKVLYAYKSRVYAQQNRASANIYAQKANEAFEKIKKETDIYNNAISKGKWKYMMSYNPRALAVFDMPPTGYYVPTQGNVGGVIPEGYSSTTDSMHMKQSLPVYNSLTDRSYFVDIFNSGTQPLIWETKTDDEWLIVSKTSGQTETEERIWISVNWELVPKGDTVHSVVRFNLNKIEYPVHINAVKPNWEPEEPNFYVEDNSVVSIEAEHYTKASYNTSDNYWQIIQGLGRENDAVASQSLKFDDIKNAPELSYIFYTTSQGKANLHFYCIPVHPVNNDYKLRFAVSIDNSEPVIVNAMLEKEMDEHNQEWKKNVLRAVSIQKTNGLINKAGTHELKMKMLDPGVVIDKIEISMGEEVDSYFGTPVTSCGNRVNKIN